MLYRRGGKWWFKFRFAGRVFREPAKTASKKLARDAERKRRVQLEEGFHGLKKRQVPQTLKVAAAAWLEMKQPTVAPKTHRIEKTHLAHILPVLGPKFISDIEPDDISRYQQHRLTGEGRAEDGQPRGRDDSRDPAPASALGERPAGRPHARGARRCRQGLGRGR